MKFISLKAPNCVHYLKDGGAATFENGTCEMADKYEAEMLEAGFAAATSETDAKAKAKAHDAAFAERIHAPARHMRG